MDDLKGSKVKSIKSSKSGKVSKLSSETKNSPKENFPRGTETIVLGNKTTTINMMDSRIMAKSQKELQQENNGQISEELQSDIPKQSLAENLRESSNEITYNDTKRINKNGDILIDSQKKDKNDSSNIISDSKFQMDIESDL